MEAVCQQQSGGNLMMNSNTSLDALFELVMKTLYQSIGAWMIGSCSDTFGTK